MVPLAVIGWLASACDSERDPHEPREDSGPADSVSLYAPDPDAAGSAGDASVAHGEGSGADGGAADVECRLSAECPGGTSCVEGRCERVGCLSDGQCSDLERCESRTCVSVLGRPCEASFDCGARAVCLEGGCVECATDEDCRFGNVCDGSNRCGPSAGPRANWIRHETDLANFVPGYSPRDFFGYGPSMALLDVDGDGRLDVALGRVPSGTQDGLCVYLNRSDADGIRFEASELLCDGTIPAEGVHVVDLDGDRVDELLIASRGALLWGEPASETPFVDLYAVLPSTDPRRECFAGASLVLDFDADGLLDVLLGCQVAFTLDSTQLHPRTTPKVLLSGSPDGPIWKYGVDDVAAAALDDPGYTLAFGAFIDDDTGLWHIVNANDTFSERDLRRTTFSPGRQHFAIAPDAWADPRDLPQFRHLPILPGDFNWASFMGVSRLTTTHGETLTLISDWGPIRALRTDPEAETGWVDVAEEVNLAMEALNGFQLFSWTMVVDDFDRDGRDDVFVVHGLVADSNLHAHSSHRHVMAFQTPDGVFERESEGFGMTLPEERPPNGFPVPPAGRSALRWDADQDGRMELIINYHLGAPELYTLDEPQSRCTLLPRPSTVVAMNAGFAHERGDGIWRVWDHGGQHRASPPSSIVVPGDTTRFRFPSGASVPVRCGDGTVQVVDEPDWIQRLPGEARIRIDTAQAAIEPVLSVRAIWRTARGHGTIELTQSETPYEWILPAIPGGAEVLLELDGRWIWRWFP